MNTRERNVTQVSSITLDVEEAEILDPFGIAPPNSQHSEAELRVDPLFLLRREIYLRIWNLSAHSHFTHATLLHHLLLGLRLGLGSGLTQIVIISIEVYIGL